MALTESVKHWAAKMAVAEWLRRETRPGSRLFGMYPIPYIKRDRADQGNYVVVEYEVMQDAVTDQLWGLEPHWCSGATPPVYDPLSPLGDRVVFDIGVVCGEELCYAIEVVYKSGVKKEKYKRLLRLFKEARRRGISFPHVYLVDADWVLDQDFHRPPDYLEGCWFMAPQEVRADFQDLAKRDFEFLKLEHEALEKIPLWKRFELRVVRLVARLFQVEKLCDARIILCAELSALMRHVA